MRGASQRAQPHWPRKLRLFRHHCQLAVERRARNPAARHCRARRHRRQRAAKPAAQVPAAVQLEPDQAIVGIHPPTRIDQPQVQIGQAERFVLRSGFEQDRIERAKAEFAAPIRTINPRLGQCHRLQRRDAPARLDHDLGPRRGEIGPRGITDHHIGQHLAARTN